MDDQSVVSLLFFLVLYLVVGLLLVWLMRGRREAAKPNAAMQESDDDIYVESGTFGKRTNYRAIALCDQWDAYLAEAPDAQLEADIKEMRKRGW